MFRILLYHFALVISLVTCDNYGEFFNEKFINSDELEDYMGRCDGRRHKLKERMANYLATQVFNIRMRTIEQNFLTSFEYAFIGWRLVLEDVYKKWGPNTDLLPLVDQDVPEIPTDIIYLNTTCDQWVDDYQPKSVPILTKRNGLRRGAKSFITRTRINLFKFYKNWYTLITSGSPIPFVKVLREKLTKHKENFPIFYKRNDIHVRFAACISRSFLLVCTTCHRVMRDLQDHFKAHPRDSFSDKLFELVPYWHLGEETVIYINILRSTLSSVAPHLLGRCTKGDISCFSTKNKNNDSVCLPYLFSKESGRVDFMKYSYLPEHYYLSFVTESRTTPLD